MSETNDAVIDEILWSIRQSGRLEKFIKLFEPKPLPGFRPHRDKEITLDALALKTAFASGALDQHERFVQIIRGSQPDSNSIKESIEE